MPIVRIEEKLVYFAHVPKCAGTSVERYLTNRFGPLALLDWRYTDNPPHLRWSRTSPQHVDRETLGRLFPPGFLSASFALVRHPCDRLVSVFRYQRDAENEIPVEILFSEWLKSLPDREPFYLDNHCRPMCDFVPEGAEVFRIEDGTKQVVDWLNDIAQHIGAQSDLPRINSIYDRLAFRNRRSSPEIKLSQDDLRYISELYAVDFERFGYEPGNCAVATKAS